MFSKCTEFCSLVQETEMHVHVWRGQILSTALGETALMVCCRRGGLKRHKAVTPSYYWLKAFIVVQFHWTKVSAQDLQRQPVMSSWVGLLQYFLERIVMGLCWFAQSLWDFKSWRQSPEDLISGKSLSSHTNKNCIPLARL